MKANLIPYIFKKFPECDAKGKIRKIYYTCSCNDYYVLNKIINEINQEGEQIFIKLKNGLMFYNEYFPQKPVCCLKYGNRKKLNKLIEYKECELFYFILVEQFIKNIYERRYKIQEGNTVVSIGASIGTNTVVFSKEVGKEGKVIAIEPDTDRLKYLEKNIRMNKVDDNIILIKKGVWDKKAKMEFYKKNPAESSSLICSGNSKKITEFEVDTLDNILADLNIKKVDFIKMDIEGAEIEALNGMRKTLKNNDVKLATASYHIVDGQPTYKTIIRMMKKLGFKSYFSNGVLYSERTE